MFYEEKQDGKITFFIPKFFFIVSKYQYYKIFHDICIDIYEIFKSPKVQIPLEVQIYNIVNQTPCPNDCKFQLCLFPYQEFNIQKLNSINFFKNVKWLTWNKWIFSKSNKFRFNFLSIQFRNNN